MHDLPVIDISSYRRGADRRSAPRAVAAALEEIGFFMVAGHGVDDGLILGTDTVCRRFFERPLDEKMALVTDLKTFHRGYAPALAETLSRTEGGDTPPDLKEQFAIGRVDVPDEPYYRRPEAAGIFVANLYPEVPTAMRPLLEAYYRAMEGLGKTLLLIFAAALQLEEDFLLRHFAHHASMLRMYNYYAHAESPAPGQTRGGTHTDYGALTILKIDDAPGGLQVRSRRGDWIDVRPVGNAFVINIGDLMMRWTNDRWLSNLHRVVNPPLGPGTRRQSIAFFMNPDFDALIECLPTCVAPGQRPRYAPILANENRRAKLLQSSEAARQDA